MGKKFQLYIKNTDTGPYKIPFDKGTPKEVQAKMNGVLKVGKKITISSEIAQYVDMGKLETDSIRHKRCKYKIREVSEMPSRVAVPSKKKDKVQEEKVEEAPVEVPVSTKTSGKKKDEDTKKGGN